jgi:hypothetical protein
MKADMPFCSALLPKAAIEQSAAKAEFQKPAT